MKIAKNKTKNNCPSSLGVGFV